MPELNWIGKHAVRAHHRDVDFHLLKDVPELACDGSADTLVRTEQSGGEAAKNEAGKSARAPLDGGNLIVQGDNLLALKALLPRCAGQVKCIYIDPPYNTGNEGWVYNNKTSSLGSGREKPTGKPRWKRLIPASASQRVAVQFLRISDRLLFIA